MQWRHSSQSDFFQCGCLWRWVCETKSDRCLRSFAATFGSKAAATSARFRQWGDKLAIDLLVCAFIVAPFVLNRFMWFLKTGECVRTMRNKARTCNILGSRTTGLGQNPCTFSIVRCWLLLFLGRILTSMTAVAFFVIVATAWGGVVAICWNELAFAPAFNHGTRVEEMIFRLATTFPRDQVMGTPECMEEALGSCI